MIPDEIKIIFNNFFQAYLPILLFLLGMIIIYFLSLWAFGENNAVTKDIEKVMDKETAIISSSLES